MRLPRFCHEDVFSVVAICLIFLTLFVYLPNKGRYVILRNFRDSFSKFDVQIILTTIETHTITSGNFALISTKSNSANITTVG